MIIFLQKIMIGALSSPQLGERPKTKEDNSWSSHS